MTGVVAATDDQDESRSLGKPAHVAPALSRREPPERRLYVLTNGGQQSLLDRSRNFNFRQLAHETPRVAVSRPCIAAGCAAFDVLVRELAPRRVKGLGQQQRHVLYHEIAFRHRSPPLTSPVSAFFSVSIARNTRVFTAPSEHPEICAISA